ncbi:MAG: hypothetical protein HY706_10745 [Candidatus Hydrogenedentes bacterium]|nr:hypothetical protein [Candidatus Hydrogenedentota bacterium]
MIMLRRNCFKIAVIGLLIGCGRGAPSPQPATDKPEPRPQGAAAQGPAVSGSGQVTLSFFDASALGGGAQLPTFRVTSQKCSMTPGGTWSLDKPRALIFSEGKENATLEAGYGEYVQAREAGEEPSERAFLREGVVLQVGTLRVELSDVEWKNAEKVARSNQPVLVTDQDTNLRAAALEYYPDTGRLVLTDVAGSLQLVSKGQS